MITVVHGGQTGTDRGAHEAAVANEWSIDGFMPRNGRDELGPIPSNVARYLQPCTKLGLAARTEANVCSCHALLIVARDANDPYVTPGTAKTIGLAASRRLRRMIVDPTSDPKRIARWIWHDLLSIGTLLLPFGEPSADPAPLRLMVAGPRESKWSGARVKTAEFLRCVGHELREISVRRQDADSP